MPRLVMLSPYRMPTHHPLMLGEEDAAAWLLAYRALWHPALLQRAEHLPQIADPQDHAEPQSDCLYVLPSSPPNYLPENWDQLVRQVGAASFRACGNANDTYLAMRAALPDAELLEAPPEAVHVLAGLGFAHAVLDTLFDAMEHQKLLDESAFAAEIRATAKLGDDWRDHAKKAAEQLLAARETLYPAIISWIDIACLRTDAIPASLARGFACNLVAAASEIEKMPSHDRDKLRNRLQEGRLELVGGLALERCDAQLPLESQLWNMRRGQARTAALLGRPARVFGRSTSAFHADLPMLANQENMHKFVFVSFDGASVPHRSSAAIRWTANDGQTFDAFTRACHHAGDPQTFFHLSHHLHQTIAHDSAAIVPLRHAAKPAGVWYEDLLAVAELCPVFGEWSTISEFLERGYVSQYASPDAPDDFAAEELDSFTDDQKDPVSVFAKHSRLRRRLDAAQSYLALAQSLGSQADADLLSQLDAEEDAIEESVGVESPTFEKIEYHAATALGKRLLSKATGGPGVLLLNPCAFTRRIAMERRDWPGLPTICGPIKAAQRDGDLVRMVVELPGLGYAWVPREPGEASSPKKALADGYTLRNEFFEADIDAATGGLRALRDARDRVNRLGQQLIWQPGATMKATSVRISANGPALGEITVRGELLDEQCQPLATFVQTFRAWAGRPLLDLQIEIHPVSPPTGYPWHAYFGSRFAWRDERATLLRGCLGRAVVTTQQRPASGDFLELRSARSSVLIVTGGLPFHQRHGARMVDTVLLPAGESATTFDMALGVDRPQPALSAQGFVSPVAIIEAPQGPRTPTGWLAHIDSQGVLLSALKPAANGKSIQARLYETGGQASAIQLRWARNPARASTTDGQGEAIHDCLINEDAVNVDIGAAELVNVAVEWD